ncbi:UNVERIFIED_CONTAM: putative ribonuclease H protein [Sesamum calycinum]|uniref:Ribonuclease H protein n=1 Tax=Sesamum calycinum TaxID=2727403 RepID=A0AAW2P9M9_9LAMI
MVLIDGILALCNRPEYPNHMIDGQETAFLNDFIEKEIYMDKPEGFTFVGEEHKTQRNAVKYRGVPFSTNDIILEVQRHLRTLYAARTLMSTQWKGDVHRAGVMGFIFRQTVPQAPSIVCWRAPSPSWFKLNTDGSSFGNPGLAGAAGIIRDSAGHVHLAYQVALGTRTSVLAELIAV